MGERVAKWVLELELENAACYVLLAVGVFVRILNSREGERGVKKQPVCTWSEVNNEVHVLVADDQDHPEMIEIQAELQRLSTLVHDVRYVHSMKFFLHDVEEEENLHLFPFQSAVVSGWVVTFICILMFVSSL
jgi:hypothetical protein